MSGGMDLAELLKIAEFVEPFAAAIAQPIMDAIRNEIAAHSGMTSEQRADWLSRLEVKLDEDQKTVDALTAAAQPDPV